MGAWGWLEASVRRVWVGKDEGEVNLGRCTVQTLWGSVNCAEDLGSVLRAVERHEQVSAGVV